VRAIGPHDVPTVQWEEQVMPEVMPEVTPEAWPDAASVPEPVPMQPDPQAAPPSYTHDTEPAETTAATMAPAAPLPSAYPLRFSGSGKEYFRIWIVNLLLTVATVGIYSAWAKVRRLQYFHRNTHLDGSVLDYHGRPWAILRGRLLALALVGAYNLAFKLSVPVGVATAAVVAALFPWLLVQSLRFRAHVTSYRGVRFGFVGTVRDAVMVLAPVLGLGVLLLATGGMAVGNTGVARPVTSGLFAAALVAGALLYPLFRARLARYTHNHVRCGQTQGTLGAGIGAFYRAYLPIMALGALLVTGIPLLMDKGLKAAEALSGTADREVVTVGVLIFASAALAYGLLLAALPLVQARVWNTTWNNFVLGSVRFRSTLSSARLMGVMLSNIVLTALTLGLFAPFAAVRLYRTRVESLEVVSAESPTFLAAHDAAGAGTTGDGVVDALGLDVGL
jgi:uncharacterized membrane protein YjgN (DUF898 family)